MQNGNGPLDWATRRSLETLTQSAPLQWQDENKIGACGNSEQWLLLSGVLL